MKYKNPGDTVSFTHKGKTLVGKIVETTLWRRNNCIAYQVVSKGQTYWIEAARIR